MRQPSYLRAAGQGHGRVQLDERDALAPRTPRGLRRLGSRGLDLGRRPAGLRAHRATLGHSGVCHERGRSGPRDPPARSRSPDGEVHRGRPRRRSARQRGSLGLRGGRGPVVDDHLEGAPLERCSRLSRPGAEALEPDDPEEGACQASRHSRRARDWHRVGAPRPQGRCSRTRRHRALGWRVQHAAPAPALWHRACRAPEIGRDRASRRQPGGRVEPPGARDDPGELGAPRGSPRPFRRHAPEVPRALARRRARQARFEHRGGTRPHPHRRLARGARLRASLRARLLLGARRRGAPEARDGDRAVAVDAEEPRHRARALSGPEGAPRRPAQPADRARGRRCPDSRDPPLARDRRDRADGRPDRGRDPAGFRRRVRRGSRALDPPHLRAHLPPLVYRADRPGGRGRRRSRAPRPRGRWPARGGRLGPAGDHPGEHQRAVDHGRGALRKLHPRRRSCRGRCDSFRPLAGRGSADERGATHRDPRSQARAGSP